MKWQGSQRVLRFWDVALFVGFLTSFEAQVAWANDETNRELVRFSTALDIERGDLPSAERSLSQHLALDSDDPQAWRLYALVLSRQGRAPAAQRALERAVALSPEAERLEVSRLLESGAEGASVAQTSQPSRHGAWMALQSGYDTNVLLLNDSTLTDSQGDAGQASPSVASSLKISRVWGAEERPWKWDTFSAYTWYSEAATQTFNALFTQSGISRGNWALDGDLTFLSLDGFGYFTWAGTAAYRPEWTWKGAGARTKWNSGTGYRKYAFESGSDVSNDRSGIFIFSEVQQRFQWGGLGLGLTPRYDHQFARGSRFRTDRAGITMAVSKLLSPRWETRLSVEPAAVFYPESDQGRSDRVLTASWALGWKAGPSWNLGMSYLGLRNVSTLASAQYTKHQAGFAVTYAW